MSSWPSPARRGCCQVANRRIIITQYDFCSVEAHVALVKHSVLREVVVEVAAIHQVQHEAELVRRMEGVRHADDKWAVSL